MIAGESERIPEVSLTGIPVNCLARGDLHDYLPIEAPVTDALQKGTTWL